MTHSDARQAEDDLAFIRRLMEGARENAGDHSPHLILWGCLQAAAELLAHLVRQGVLQVSINAIWAVALGIGFAGSRLLTQRTRKRAPVNTLVDRLLVAIWIGCALALSLVGFLGAATGSLPPALTPGIKSVIIGSAFFSSAFLPDRAFYRLLASAWWILGGALLVHPWQHAPLMLACAQILLMAVPGVVLRMRRVPPRRVHLIP